MAQTTSSSYAALVQAAYNLEVDDYLRDQPSFRSFVDTSPGHPDKPGSSIVMSIAKPFAALATTPLTEGTNPTPVSAVNPGQVTVTPLEYGNYTETTHRLQETSFVAVDPLIVKQVGDNMLDTIDQLIRTVMDGAARGVMRTGAAGTSTTTSVLPGSVTGTTSRLDAVTVGIAVTRLRSDLAPTWGGSDYMFVVHPDVSFDLRQETGAAAWLTPKGYVDPSGIYQGEIGTFLGARFVENARATKAADGASTSTVYRSYAFGRQAVAEAVTANGEPGIVVGEVTDPLRRVMPIGWKAMLGWSLYRPESLRRVLTGSSLSAMA